MTKAASAGVAVEVNADPHRLDLDWRIVRRALKLGVSISIGADSHSASTIHHMELGLGIARKGWATSGAVLNTRDLDSFLEHVRNRRAHAS